MHRSKCPDCNSVAINLFEDQGDGKCDKCLGQGHGDLMDQFATTFVPDAKSQCLKCNGTGQCQTCGGTGFVNYVHSTSDTTNSSSSNTDSSRQESSYSASSGSSADYSSSSGGSGCGVIIGWIIGIIIAVVIVIWLALNIVLPIALLNSALALTILALCYKERKTLFASLALVGGCYLLLDIFKGWFSANFVANVVGNPVWITCFVYLNAAAIGLSVWFLVQPIWANAKEIKVSDKKKSLLLMGVSILLVATATITIPIVYHRFQNPFLNDFKTKEVSSAPTIQVFGPGLSIDLGNNVKLELVRIPAGTFTMGSPSNEAERGNDEEQHQVTITNAFYLGKYEVTQAQWQAVMGTTAAQQRDKKDPKLAMYGEGGNYPMYYVNWDEAQEFIKRLNRMNKEGFTYRLPTDAEWEYAARAGTTSAYAGNLGEMAWYSANSGATSHPVGQKWANAWGLYDMHGNVIEWCQDWNGVSYTAAPAVDPSGPVNGKERVLRGGSWYVDVRSVRSASRRLSTPDFRAPMRGFRVAAQKTN